MAAEQPQALALAAGSEALERGDFAGARSAFQAALDEGESAAVHAALAAVCLVLEDLGAARRHGEAAYRLHRLAGDLCRAAAAALTVAQVHEWLGQEAAVRGWLRRTERLLEEAGPCVEHGYLELARAGCDVRDVAALEQSANRALEIARQFHDRDLEARAIADGGLALVCQGRIAEGLALLDEAMAAVVAGEVHHHGVAGLTCCSMLTACERLGDLRRAALWTDAVNAYMRDRFGEGPPSVLQSHCRLVYGGLLSAGGRWAEAEAEFRHALGISVCLPKHAVARGGIAELYVRQGRFFEAEELIAGLEDRVEVTSAMTRLLQARGQLDLAAATLERSLLRMETDLLSSAPLLALHVEIEIERGDLDMAATSAARLTWIASETKIATLAALAHLSSARVAGARGDDRVPHLRAAQAAVDGDSCPPLSAQIHLELAIGLRETDPAAAGAEARCALAIFDRLGAREDLDRTSALLRGLGVTVRTTSVTNAEPDILSRREREVLPLIAEGLSNAEIARRLFITVRTTEHHVSSILAKLQLRNRAEIAAHMATRRPAGP